MGWNGPLTHRQLMAWLHWLNAQWNEPSRTDHYLMQISADIRRTNAKNPRAIKTESTRIRFSLTTETNRHKESVDDMKRRWGAFVGVAPPPEALTDVRPTDPEDYVSTPSPEWREIRDEQEEPNHDDL